MQPVLGQAGDDASRVHTESDLRIYLAWCAERSVDPLAVERAQVELYVRLMQEVRRFKPSTVSRRMSVVAGFYRTCVIEGVLDHASRGYRQANRPAQHRQVGWADSDPPVQLGGRAHLSLDVDRCRYRRDAA